MGLDGDNITRTARRLGFDLVGFVEVAALEGSADAFHPSGFAPHLPTLIVVARHNFEGLRVARHDGTRQFWGGRLLKRSDDQALGLTNWLESEGAAATPFSSLMVNYAAGGALQLTPAGQGSELLRRAAVAAGLGTLGLNGMLLTPEFGPRIYLSGVLTDAPLPASQPLEDELCPGLQECGWCAAACPAGAIPRQAEPGRDLARVRGLDRTECASRSQPLGLQAFRDHLHAVVEQRPDPEAVWKVVGSRTTGALWQEMIMIKEGVFTGCSECVLVCPVGADVEGRNPPMTPPEGFERIETEELVVIRGGADG